MVYLYSNFLSLHYKLHIFNGALIWKLTKPGTGITAAIYGTDSFPWEIGPCIFIENYIIVKGTIFPAVQCALGCRGTRVCNLITIALIAGNLFRFVPHAGFVRVIVGITTTFSIFSFCHSLSLHYPTFIFRLPITRDTLISNQTGL